MHSRLKLRLLGPFEAWVGRGLPVTFSNRRSQALLACLALRPGHAHPRESLMALLWGEADDVHARQNLRQALTDLRKALKGNPGLLITRQAVTLRKEDVDTDVTTFERLLAEGTPGAIEQALALYRGELLDGFSLKEESYEQWLRAKREGLRTLAMHGLAKLVAQQMDAAQDERAIRTATQLLELEPFHEPAHRALMRLHQRQGRRAAALRQYQVCVGILRRELGTEPEEETRILYQEIVARRPSPRLSAPAVTPAASTPVAGALPPRLLQAHDTTFVGRAKELAALREALSQAWRDSARTALILGEAGIGKSRLTEELAAHASAKGARVFSGRSFELEQILPFRPWADAFRDGQLTADCPELAGLSPVWQVELARLLPEWGMRGPETGERSEDRLRLYEAVAHLLSHLARQQPVLVILEDLHWADESSLRLLAFLNHRIASTRVLLLGTARDDELEASAILGRLLRELASDARTCRLALAPLSRPDLETLARELLRAGGSPPALEELVARIWWMSEGNPFVAVEAARSLGQRDAPSAHAMSDVPERVREMLGERLEQLDENARELAAIAAVIGRELDFSLLQLAAGSDARATARALEKLVRRRVLHPVGERFTFTHERIRQVVYAQLLPPRRRAIHEQVAAAMEELYADNLVPHSAALGAHFEQAGIWDRAATYMRRAGIQAHEHSASREATICFERALRSLDRLPRSQKSDELAIDLRLDLQSSLTLLGELPRIDEHLRQARALAETIGDRQRLGRVLTHATHCSWWLGDCDAALESGTAAAAIAGEIGDVALQIMADYRLGQVYFSRAEYGRARELLARAVELLAEGRARERFGMPSLPAIVSRTFLSWVLALLGEFDSARAIANEGARIAEALGHPYSVALAYRGLGLAPLVQGDFSSAIAPFERALQICQTRELPFMTPFVAGDLGRAYALSGRNGEAVALLERTVEETAKLRLMMIHPRDVTALAEAYVLAGRAAEALRSADRALGLARAHKQRGVEAEALKVLGDAATLEPDGRERAKRAYHDSLALAEALGLRPLVASCHLGMGKLYSLHGDALSARKHLDTAVTRFRGMGMAFWVEQADMVLRRIS